MMKKLLTLTLACAMTLSLAACGSKAESPADSSADQNTAAPTESDAKTYKVAVIKQLDHASLHGLHWQPAPYPMVRKELT